MRCSVLGRPLVGTGSPRQHEDDTGPGSGRHRGTTSLAVWRPPGWARGIRPLVPAV